MPDAASPTLDKVRAYLEEAGLPPEVAQEYFIAPQELGDLRNRLMEETRGNYHVMNREEGERLHVIAFLNVRGIGELFADFEAASHVHQADGAPPRTPAAGSAENEIEF